MIEGTGLFLGTGLALQRAGPLSIFLAYSIVGVSLMAAAVAVAGGTDPGAYRHGGLFDGSESRRDCHLAAHKRWLDRLRISGMLPFPAPAFSTKIVSQLTFVLVSMPILQWDLLWDGSMAT